MIHKKIHSSFSLFYLAEGVNEAGADTPVRTVEPVSGIHKSENEALQADLNEKNIQLTAAQEATIAMAKSLEKIANDRIEAVLASNYLSWMEPEERRKKIQDHVGEFIRSYQEKYTTEKAELMELREPPLSKEEIDTQLAQHEHMAFEEFLNEKRTKMRELRKQKRMEGYLARIDTTGDDQKDAENRALVVKYPYKYKDVKAAIIAKNPELADDKVQLRKEINAEIDSGFRAYCILNDIPLKPEQAEDDRLQDEQGDGGSDESDEQIVIAQTKSILQAQDEYLNQTTELKTASSEFQETIAQYPKVTDVKTESSELSYLATPEKIANLEGGEKATFVDGSNTNPTIYEAYRESDGEYTVSFRGIVIKDLPREEVDAVVNLNAIPAINTLFSTTPELYRSLSREYVATYNKPIENPPLDFINYLYERLNAVYMRENPESNIVSLLGVDLGDMTREDRGNYIRKVLMTNSDMSKEVMKRLLKSHIILDSGKINLSKFPQ